MCIRAPQKVTPVLDSIFKQETEYFYRRFLTKDEINARNDVYNWYSRSEDYEFQCSLYDYTRRLQRKVALNPSQSVAKREYFDTSLLKRKAQCILSFALHDNTYKANGTLYVSRKGIILLQRRKSLIDTRVDKTDSSSSSVRYTLLYKHMQILSSGESFSNVFSNGKSIKTRTE